MWVLAGRSDKCQFIGPVILVAYRYHLRVYIRTFANAAGKYMTASFKACLPFGNIIAMSKHYFLVVLLEIKLLYGNTFRQLDGSILKIF